MAARPEAVPRDSSPEDEDAERDRYEHDDHRREQRCLLERPAEQPRREQHQRRHREGHSDEPKTHGPEGILTVVVEANYTSGEDYVVEFLGYRFGFNAYDFEQRVTAAAVKLGLISGNELDEDETADLVELAADGRIDEPRSPLGRYLVRHWERLSLLDGESLVYWVRKLVFRGAWLDHRVKENLLEVAWDDEVADFGYRDPRGGRALLELAPVPSWHELQFRR